MTTMDKVGDPEPAGKERAPGLVVAVDAGATKTDIAIVDGEGHVLATACGAGLPETESLRSWMATLDRLMASVGYRQGGGESTVLSACVASVDLPEQERDFTEAARDMAWTDHVIVMNDTFAVLRSGVVLGGSGKALEGVGVVCGTGINCVGASPDGQQARFLAFGEISGDWGGGNDLGMAAVWHAIRDEDGRGRPTELRPALRRHFNVQSMREIALRFHDGRLNTTDIRHCTPVLMAVAAGGDPIALGIVQQQGAEICAMVRVALQRIGLTEQGAMVVLGGSVLAAGHEVLLHSVVDGVGAFSPASTVAVADVPPVAGAALFGLDYLGNTASAEAALRCAAWPSRSGAGAGKD